MPRSRPLFLLSLAALLLAGSAWACSVPVFRYALERWRHGSTPEDLFRVAVFHKGPLGPEQTALLNRLDPQEGSRANWLVETIDLDDNPTEDQHALWQKQVDAALPWVVVRPPAVLGDRPPLYAGPLDAAALERLTDSPARRAVAGKLLAGDSVVWVLIESGDADRDDAVAAQVRRELDRLEKTIRLPETDDDPESALRSKVPLRLSFPLVRVSRTAAGEEAFLAQVFTLGEDFRQTTGPLLVPIFGRGRMLVGYAEKEITPRNLEEACRFLCGACSCQVKALNPGTDLLWRADWDSILDDAPPPLLREASPRPVELPRKPAGGTTLAEMKPEEPGWGRALLLAGIGSAAAVVLVAGWLAFRLSRGV